MGTKMSNDLCIVYITTGSFDEAAKIGKMLVEESLSACVNIIGGMHAIYRWQGKIQTDEECVLIAKTRTHLIEPVTVRVKECHSYECPCVVAIPVVGGNPDFLDWIDEQVK